MTWWRRGKRRSGRPSSETLEAQAALAASQRRLDEACAQDTHVHSVVDKLLQLRERNNFAGMMAAAFREHR